MQLQEAQPIASDLVSAMRPYCERVEIAGSVRRGKLETEDIEIVALPRCNAGTRKNS